jgi:cytochrome b561
VIALRNTQTQFGLVARVLHWTSVALVFAAVAIAVQSTAMESGPEKTATLTKHAVLGITILCVMLTRLYWRIVSVNPVNSYRLPRWHKVLAMSLHRGLYALLLMLALTGILQVMFRGDSLGVLDGLGITNVVTENALLGELWRDVHVRLTYVLYAAVAVHVLGATVHQIFGVRREEADGAAELRR